jgi:hypothetical protein
MLAVDRACPTGATCQTGYCAPPAAAQSCDAAPGPQENQCLVISTTLSCQPFIVGQQPVWRCVHAVGAGAIGTVCTAGSQCRSGFCGSNGTCFRACVNTIDCPVPATGKPFRCDPTVQITVEGQVVHAGSCVPT